MPPKQSKEVHLSMAELGKAITNYTKNLSDHSISNTNLENKNFLKAIFINEPMNSLKAEYKRMKERLEDERENFNGGEQEIKRIISGYFLKMRKILHEQEAKTLERFNEICSNFTQSIEEHLQCIEERSDVLESMYRKREHISKDFEEKERNNIFVLSKLNLPCFELHLEVFDTFKVLAEKFCPNFLVEGVSSHKKPHNQSREILKENIPAMNQHLKLPLQDIQNNESPDNTIKKIYYPQVKSQSDLCEFSCDETLDWDSKASQNHRRHEIVSEIILEESSSCEDSLMLN